MFVAFLYFTGTMWKYLVNRTNGSAHAFIPPTISSNAPARILPWLAATSRRKIWCCCLTHRETKSRLFGCRWPFCLRRSKVNQSTKTTRKVGRTISDKGNGISWSKTKAVIDWWFLWVFLHWQINLKSIS